MKKVLGILLLTTLSPMACKSKQKAPLQQSADAQVQLRKIDAWEGVADQIDPQVGTIKSLDEGK